MKLNLVAVSLIGLLAFCSATALAERGPQAAEGRETSADSASGPVRTANWQDQRLLPPRNAAGRGPSERSGVAANAWKSAAGLAVVLALLIGGARWCLRKQIGTVRSLPPEAWETLGSAWLGPKHHVYALRWGSRVLLVAIGPNGPQTLSEATEPGEVDRLLRTLGVPLRRDDPAPARSETAPSRLLAASRRDDLVS